MQKISTKVLLALLLLVTIVIGGVIGFKLLADYSWIDAFYMTVITVTTVGFGEVVPLSADQKLFTGIYIILSISIFGYAISTLIEFILSTNNIGTLKQRRMQKEISTLSNHIVVCGYGRNGKEAVQKLSSNKMNFVIIENSEEQLDQIRQEGFYYIAGDATQDEVLEMAGIEKAKVLLCSLPSDADNLFIVLSARQLNQNLTIISRSTDESSNKKLKLAGADQVIMPDRIGGSHMASLVVNPDLIEFMSELANINENEEVEDQILVKKINFSLLGSSTPMSIAELNLRKDTGCSIIGVQAKTGEYTINPEANMVLEEFSQLIIVGNMHQMRKLKSKYPSLNFKI